MPLNAKDPLLVIMTVKRATWSDIPLLLMMNRSIFPGRNAFIFAKGSDE